MTLDDPVRDTENNADVSREIAFAPKELKIAQELSERLGAYTYEGRSRSRPTGLAKGHRSSTQSDQRRPLMLPQELMQMPDNQLIVLRAGMPAVRGCKIAFWRERVFTRRQRPAPAIPPHPRAGQAARPLASTPNATVSPQADADLRLDLKLPALTAAGLEPLPAHGASEAEVAEWVERFIDSSVVLPGDPDHGR